ncbi:MAG: tetratricopeptide repeat protein [Acidobacteriota bacterium]|nr:tetratricopeptide repeat protein [Acidobacteriota bacterium]
MSANNRFLRVSPVIKPVIAFIALLLVFGGGAVTDAGGQGRSSPVGSGVNKIHGRVRFPSNSPATSVRVRLEGSGISSIMTVTDSEGMFYFNGLSAGQYTVIVEAGEDYEVFREVVEIDPPINVNTNIYLPPSPRTFNVMADLRLKGTIRNRPGVINASLAAVPKAALKEFRKALEAQSKGDTNLAIEKLGEAVKLHPQFFEAHAELGSLYLKTNQLEKAVQSLRAAIELNDKNPNVRLNYGIALLNKKEMTEAEREFREVIKADKTAATAHMYLGIALLGQKRVDEAETMLLQALSLKDDEKLAQAHRFLGGIYWGKGNYRRAADELEKYLKLAPQATDAAKIRDIIKSLREETK